MTNNSHIIFETKELHVGYGPRTVVDNTDLDILSGEIVIITGPNGCGKTTLLDAICGFLPYNARSMKFQDRDFLALNPYQRAEFGLGRLFQRGGVFLSLTVPQHLTIALNGNKSGSIIKSIQKKPRDFIKESNLPELSLRLLSAAGIRANDIRLAGQLSFGQRRTLAFACIIVRKPLLLLLDEPYVGLDTNVREVVRAAIINFASKGCGVLIVEHELSETEGISNRILKMHNGKLSVVET